MRRFHLLPALAIFACLSMGADTREEPAKAAPPGKEAPKVTVAAEPAPPPSLQPAMAPDASSVRAWCDTQEKGAIELANALRSRSIALEERERLIALREEELKKTESRIVDRLTEIKKIREQISQKLEDADTEKKTKVDELVKMVEANRPSNIVGMFEALDEDLAVQVLDRMNPNKAGKLLAVCNPVKAARLAGKMTHPVGEQVAAADPAPPAAAPATAPAAPPPAATPPTTPPASPPK